MPDPVGAAPAEAAAPAIDRRAEKEVLLLKVRARRIAFGLTAAIVVAFVGGVAALDEANHLVKLGGIALVGFAGSGVGALTSLLSRYAAGFELEDGTRVPAAAEGELFNARIAFCFIMRPVLGALVAPLIVGGVGLFFSTHETLKGSLDAMMLVSFIGGLYAKSVLEAAKNAFKVVFRA